LKPAATLPPDHVKTIRLFFAGHGAAGVAGTTPRRRAAADFLLKSLRFFRDSCPPAHS